MHIVRLYNYKRPQWENNISRERLQWLLEDKLCIFIHFKKLVQCYVSYWKTENDLKVFYIYLNAFGDAYNYC